MFLTTALAAPQRPSQPAQPIHGISGHPRVAIISDIVNEPDDQMSFVRLLLYSNQLDLEAVIATTSTWQRTATNAETMHALIHAMARFGATCCCMQRDGPPQDLDAHVFAGQAAYGMPAVGQWKASAGSRAPAEAIERDDERPCGSAFGVAPIRWPER